MTHGDSTPPGDFIRAELDRLGWSQRDLALVLNRPLPSINEIINGKRAIMPEMAKELALALGTSAEIWMARESEYRLALAEPADESVRLRAWLHSLGPLKEMEKRGWIRLSDDVAQLQSDLEKFFDQDVSENEPQIAASLRSSFGGQINPAQRAWCCRARTLAKASKVANYDESKFDVGVRKLRRLAAWPDHAAKVPAVLANMGIRFVVVEPLSKTRIDGAAFWLDELSPVIALSARYDRIDNFWHTLGHELSHIKHRDGFSLDVDLREPRESSCERSEIERRADEEACAMWIDQDALQSFIVRVAPLYSRERINQFANRIKIHPGVILGQLQGRGEVGFQMMRDQLVRVRDHITSESITDGWGRNAPEVM